MHTSSIWRAAVWSTAIVGSLSVLGCEGGSGDELDRRPISGKVTLDGAPLGNGVISFDPVEGSPGTTPAGGAVLDGAYSIAAAAGPTPGRYKVSIRSAKAGERDASQASQGPGPPPPKPKKGQKPEADPIPAKYNVKSELTAEVPADGTATVDFALTTE